MLTRWLMMATAALLALLSGCNGRSRALAGVAPAPIPHPTIRLENTQVQPATVHDGETLTVTATADATSTEVSVGGVIRDAPGGNLYFFDLHDDGLDGDIAAGDGTWTYRFVLDLDQFDTTNSLSGTLHLEFLITPDEGGEYESQYADLPGITVEDGMGTD